MSKNEKCNCPLCGGHFIPEKGQTAEECIAREIIQLYREMQNKPHDFIPPCPRCGKKMEPVNERNAVSRLIDVYICSECGTDEAVRDAVNDVMLLQDWLFVKKLLEMISGAETCNRSIHMRENFNSQYKE